MLHTILLVDDSSQIRRSVRSYIENFPEWEVCGEAENGQQGIERAQQLRPDLIVLDLSMPVMNGMEAASILKHLMPAVPLIIFSDYSTLISDAQARSAGVSALVSKTESLSMLLGKASALLA